MLRSAFKLAEEIHLRKLEYKVYPKLWRKYKFPGINLDFSSWSNIKYLNKAANDFHADINKIPNNTGGLYLFYIPCPIVTGLTEYPFYIGRAQYTASQNLRKRVREYFTTFRHEEERPLITKMFEYWGSDLHLAFLSLPTNLVITDFEKKIINSLLLPMNTEIPDQLIRQAVKAF